MPTRYVRLSAIVALALVVVGAIVATAQPGGSSPTAPSADARAAAAVVAGIPEHRGVLGDPSAPVTVTEFVDLQCPVCAAVSKALLPEVIRDYVRTGKVKLELRTLHFLGPDSERAARAAAGAERQNRLWAFVEAFYARQGAENSGYVTDDFLRAVADAAGVDADAMLGQVEDAFAQRRLERADADAARLGIAATPTFTVARGDARAQVVDASSLLGVLQQETAR